jgi:hypothetical protein
MNFYSLSLPEKGSVERYSTGWPDEVGGELGWWSCLSTELNCLGGGAAWELKGG